MIAGAAVEVVALHRPFVAAVGIPALIALVLANLLRWWVIATLGVHWNVRVVRSTELGIVTGGPYRYVRHPNYVAVFVELAALPLVHGAVLTAVAGAVLHVVVLGRRIALEESVLMADERYRAAFAQKPRFLPWWTPPTSSSPARGRPGATLALALGRAGLRVDIYDARRFPREKPCGEGILPAGVAVLDRLGLRHAVGGRPLHTVRYHGFGVVAESPFGRAGAVALAQRRLVLDQVLLDAARVTPGVRVFEDAEVEGVERSQGRAVGLRVGGEIRRAALVVGRRRDWRSCVRRALGLDGRRAAAASARACTFDWPPDAIWATGCRSSWAPSLRAVRGAAAQRRAAAGRPGRSRALGRGGAPRAPALDPRAADPAGRCWRAPSR